GKDPGEQARAIMERLGTPHYTRIDAPATPQQKAVLKKLSPESVRAATLAGEPIRAKLVRAPGNGAEIGGLKVVADQGWFAERAVVDGEIVIVGRRGLEFEALLLRIHPAASRVKLLAQESPASYVAFDLLALGEDDLRGRPLSERREKLERALGKAKAPVHLT